MRIYPHNVDPIADGAVLYSCHVRVAADAPLDSYLLDCRSAEASDPDGVALPTECRDGALLPPGQMMPEPTRAGRPTRDQDTGACPHAGCGHADRACRDADR